MLGKEMLTTMFAYNDAMNAHLLDCATRVSDAQLDAPADFGRGSLRQTLLHMLGVEWAWGTGSRTRTSPTTMPAVMQNPTLPALRVFAQEEAATMRTFLDGLSDDDLRESFDMERQGRTTRFTLWQTLVHRAYHSAQHRSEVAALLTQYGQSPGDMDFLFFTNPELRPPQQQ